MCGVVGIWRHQGVEKNRLVEQMEPAVASLLHRGPDDSGIWVDAAAGLALGQRRLAILDLSPNGHQPMLSPDGRWALVFNGEVYNFLSLRAELEPQGFKFKGGSDTEVVLAAICHWGFEKALTKFVGMFALAAWNKQERCLWLARDRMGIKPLYYFHTPSRTLFASELKALMAIPDFPREIDMNSLGGLLQYRYIPSSKTIFQNTRRLLPGHYARIDQNGLVVKQYWNLQEIAREGLENRLELSDAEVEAQLEALIRESVRLRMIADVPLGAFLSGGIDSSTVVAAMQAEASGPVKTFTICFTDEYFDEGRFARPIAQHLGTDHTELYVTPEIAQSVIPLLPAIYDEPFADSSVIPTYLVSKLARQQVTVALSGDGGDELFGGYPRYIYGQRFWRLGMKLPRNLRFLLADVLDQLPAQDADRFFQRFRLKLPAALRFNFFSDRLAKVTSLMRAPTELDIYQNITSFWENPGEVLLGNAAPGGNGLWLNSQSPLPRELTELMMVLDQTNYLPEDILTKVDRASMAVSLEARVPLLDHRLVSWVWRLPLRFKIRNGQGKWLLRRVLSKYVPVGLFTRPKTGFGIPLGPWLRGPLKEWAADLLARDSLQGEGIFHAGVVQRYWQEHLSGVKNRQSHLWPILMFRSWKQHWLEGRH